MIKETAKRIANYEYKLNRINNILLVYRQRTGVYSIEDFNESKPDCQITKHLIAVMSYFKNSEISIDYSKAIAKLEKERDELTKQYKIDMEQFTKQLCNTTKPFWCSLFKKNK